MPYVLDYITNLENKKKESITPVPKIPTG